MDFDRGSGAAFSSDSSFKSKTVPNMGDWCVDFDELYRLNVI